MDKGGWTHTHTHTHESVPHPDLAKNGSAPMPPQASAVVAIRCSLHSVVGSCADEPLHRSSQKELPQHEGR